MSKERRRKQIERMVKAEFDARQRTPWWRSAWGFLGISLTAIVGLVITFTPKFSITPGPSLIQNEPFSVPFKITNEGYTSETINVISLLYEVQMQRLKVDGTLYKATDWDGQILERGDSKTIRINLERGMGIPASAVIGIRITCTEFGLRHVKVYQFEGKYGDNWQWWPQPTSDDLLKRFDKVLAENGESQ
jgi:hypothetical protein